LKRYVDDVITSLPEFNDIFEFSESINSINENIQYNHEVKVNGTLPFQDLNLIRTQNVTLEFKINRKTTDAAYLIDYNSYNHQSHKRNVVKSLLYKIYKLCSPQHVEDELKIAE